MVATVFLENQENGRAQTRKTGKIHPVKFGMFLLSADFVFTNICFFQKHLCKNSYSLSVKQFGLRSFINYQLFVRPDLGQKVNEYDQEMTKSHTADQLAASQGRDTENLLPYDNKKTIKETSSLPQRDDCKTRKDTKYCITKQRPNTKTPQTMGTHRTR